MGKSWRIKGEPCSVLISLSSLRYQFLRNLELQLIERHRFLSPSFTFPSFKHSTRYFDLTSISPSLFSPHTLLNSRLRKHLYQEQIVFSLLTFQLRVFFCSHQEDGRGLPYHSFCARVREALQLLADVLLFLPLIHFHSVYSAWQSTTQSPRWAGWNGGNG